MYFSFSIVTPANIPKRESKITYIPLRPGVIHIVSIQIPPGHRGLAHLKITHMLKQLYPLNSNEDIHGDGVKLEFKEFYELFPHFEDLKAHTWNEDEENTHEFIIGIGILPRKLLLPFEAPAFTEKLYEGMIGTELEVPFV